MFTQCRFGRIGKSTRGDEEAVIGLVLPNDAAELCVYALSGVVLARVPSSWSSALSRSY